MLNLTTSIGARRITSRPGRGAWLLAVCAAAAGAPIAAAQVAGTSAGFAPSTSVQPWRAARYQVIDLGEVPASSVCPCFFGDAIGDGGHAVGFFFGPDGEYHGFLSRGGVGGVMVDVGSLGAAVTRATAVNAHGVVAGLSQVKQDVDHAFTYKAGVMTDLGTLGGVHSWAYGINDAGVVVGGSLTGGHDDFQRATMWAGGKPKDLGTLGGEYSNANDINNAGEVVGWAWDAGRKVRAFRWSAGSGMIDLGDLGVANTVATAINDAGVVVGVGKPGELDRDHAFLWADGVMIDLGVLAEAGTRSGDFGPELVNTAAAGINGAGQVVGNSYPGTVRPGPFLWEDGEMMNLNDLINPFTGWVITDVGGINEAGEIVGSARNRAGERRAVVLVPR